MPAIRHALPDIRYATVAILIGMLGATSAFAASVAVNGGSLGMASTSTPRCTSAGLGILQNLLTSNVISVTVSGLPPGCGGATIQVAVNNSTTSSTGSAIVPAGGGSVTVSLALPVAIGTAEAIDLVLTGP